MKTKTRKNIFSWVVYVYLFFFKFNTYSQQLISTVKFENYISKMNLDQPIRITNGIEKVNLTIFDFEQNVTIDTTGIKIIDSHLRPKTSITHADKTITIIKKNAGTIVKITHINTNNDVSVGNNIGYFTELKKVIDNAKNGEIIFLIFNNPQYWGAKEENPEKLDLFKKAIFKNVIIIESAGNQSGELKYDIDIPTIVVGGAVPTNSDYRVSMYSNFGKAVDIYGPSGIEIRNDTLFNESSSGSTVIASMAVRLQYECKSSVHKFLDAYEMKDIFTKANSTLKVIENGGTIKKIPQYINLLDYAKTKYFDKRR